MRASGDVCAYEQFVMKKKKKKDQPVVELGREGPRTPGKTGPFTEAAPGSGDRAAALGCLRCHLISCYVPHGFNFHVL